MRPLFSFFFGLLFIVSCAQNKTTDLGKTPFQKKMNSEFKDASKSPLKSRDLKKFKGLDFFEYDSSFVVTAKVTRLENSKSFKMKTTTDRVEDYIIYGELTFELQGKPFKLNLYQNQDLTTEESFENYLFLPFLDDTNGDESYGGGRYIDMRIPEGEVIKIDFNSAYNPYCAYNEKFSCPIVPRENYLELEIRAGVKAFKKQ